MGKKRRNPATRKKMPRKVKISEQTEECIDCHSDATPGIVADWEKSLHAQTTFAEAIKKPKLQRRVSATSVPKGLESVAVGCYECHSLNAKDHKDNFEHNDYKINVIVSPRDCATCHPEEEKQYSMSKKAHAVENLEKNPLYHTLVKTITGKKEFKDGKLLHRGSSYTTRAETRLACHGTKIEVKGMRTIINDGDEVEVPNLIGWPNQGVGRINPDGSKGSCTACHPRHSFSIEIARKPYTCSQCHLLPDVPAWDVYKESKHGNIFQSVGNQWNWTAVPWTVGQDFTAPTCASCHNSLVVKPSGDVVAERTHDFGARLWVRLFGLIYSHPQPKRGDTHIIKNADGQPLPVTFGGKLASEYLIDEKEQKIRKNKMKRVCNSCHSTDWIDKHFQKLDHTLKETDQMVKAATDLMIHAWKHKLADPKNPFDEPLEYKWINQWLFYANSVRYGSAMMGPDYNTFKNGWYYLQKNLQEMQKEIERMEAMKKEKDTK